MILLKIRKKGIMRKSKSRRSSQSKTLKPGGSGKKTGLKTQVNKKHGVTVSEKVKKPNSSKSEKRGPSPDELEDKREMHRIHERQRHYSLNVAIRKIISALPSCEPSEPETKHYVLKKTSDYIQFLEDKIADMCLDMDIDQINDCGDLSFSAPLHIVIDGFQKDIPANTPVSMDSLQELLAHLNHKEDNKSLITKRKSSKGKAGTTKKPQCKKQSVLQVGEISDECLQEYDDELQGKDAESLGVNSQDSLLSSGSLTDMMCSESTLEMDASRSSQMNSSSTCSSWGSGSLDDGFSSSKMTTDQESTQGSGSTNSSHDLSQSIDSLADLIGGETGVKFIPALPEVNQRRGSRVLNQWSRPTAMQEVVLSVPALCNPLSAPSVEKGGPISFLWNREVNEPYIQPDSTTFLPLQQGSCNLSGIAITPTSATHLFPGIGSQYDQDTQHAPIPITSQGQLLSHSDAPRAPHSKNILNQSLVSDIDSNPTFGYINCTLSNCSAGKVIGPKNGISYSSVHPYETYHPQASLFQPVKQTVEIILDVGDDPMALMSVLGEQTCCKRSGINGFELFTKVNIERFQVGWPALKSKEIARLMGQAWNEIPDNFKQLYGKRALAWNQRQKKHTGLKSTLLDP